MADISVLYLANIYRACAIQGAGELMLSALLPEGRQTLFRKSGRVPASVAVSVLDATIEHTGRLNVPLECAKTMKPEAFSAIGKAVSAAATLRDAIRTIIRYQPLAQTFCRSELAEVGLEGRIAQRFVPGLRDPNGTLAETSLITYAVMQRWLTWSRGPGLLELRFRHADRGQKSAIEAEFACKAIFGAEENEMVMRRDWLDTLLPEADQDQFRALNAALDRELAALGAMPSLEAATQAMIADSLQSGPPSQERVAEELGLSERTLRRRLSERGTSFRELLDEARQEACRVLLAEGQWSMAQIAHMLGYSEQSAFSRAFRRWYGVPPGQFDEADLMPPLPPGPGEA